MEGSKEQKKETEGSQREKAKPRRARATRGCARAKLLQSCLTLCDPMDCSSPGSSVHGIPQARILENSMNREAWWATVHEIGRAHV